MNVIVITVAFNQLSFKIGADFCEYSPEVAYHQIRQNITPEFSNEDQVYAQHVNDMSTSSIRHLALTWTNCQIHNMKRRGYQYKLHPSDEQASLFVQFAGVCRLVYNVALE